jgi:hypothetical protein
MLFRCQRDPAPLLFEARRPGRQLGGKRLELLKESIPKLSRVAFLFDPTGPSNLIELEQLRGPLVQGK